jgi:hypothetical protein
VEAAARQTTVGHQRAQFGEHAPRVRQREAAGVGLGRQRRARHQRGGQRADERRVHRRQQPRRGFGVLARAFNAADPQHHHHRMPDAGAAQACRGLDGVVGARALVHAAQHLVVAALGAVVDDAQPCLAQRRQLAVILAQDGARVTVDAHAAHLRQPLAQQGQDLEQPLRGQHQGVAVTQEHAADRLHVAIVDRGFFHVLRHDVERLHPEALHRVTVHAAVGAPVVAAADGHLQQQALGLAGRAEDVADVVHAAAAFVVSRPGLAAPGNRTEFVPSNDHKYPKNP